MNILICDDDICYAQECKTQIEKLASAENIAVTVQIVESGKQLLFFKDTKYAKMDLVYLDQNMPGMSGMDTALEMRRNGIVADIVFYTVDESKAIDAFDVEAMHYIVKGKTSEQKFKEIFCKAVKRGKSRHQEVISLSCAGEHRNISIQDIQYFEVQNKIVTVHYGGDHKETLFEFYSSLSKIDEFLYGKGFIRIHASYLVAKRCIRKANTQRVELITGREIPVGKSYRENVSSKRETL